MSTERLGIRDSFLELEAMLDRCSVAHAFIGALAVLAWGRTRATTDLDVVILAESGWEAFAAELRNAGYELTREVGPEDGTDPLPDIAMFRRPGGGAVRIDVFIAKTPFEREVIASARTAEVLGRSIRLARPEASIIYKLIARRPKDLGDVEGIFEARRAAREELDWSLLERWARDWDLLDELAPYRQRFG